MAAVPIRTLAENKAKAKTVAANQKSIEELSYNSGIWRVEGVMGLYVRCRAQSKSFILHRRVQGTLVQETLGQISDKFKLKQARDKATKIWTALKPKPAAQDVVTLGIAIDRYVEEKTLSQKTKTIHKYNRDRYLKDWTDRSLRDVANDRVGFRFHVHQIRRKHGVATYNQVIKLVSAVHNWERKIDPSLPENPATAVEVESIPARDWGYSREELRAWWLREGKDGAVAELGVKTLGPIKRMWWLTALFTGARKASIEALRWQDINAEKRTIYFGTTKGNRPYSVPASDALARLLAEYRASDQVPPSEWVFPSNVIEGAHLTNVKETKESGVGQEGKRW